MKTYYYIGHGKDGIDEIIETSEIPKMIHEGGKYYSMSQRYDSLEELKQDNEIIEQKCKECGGIIKTAWTGSVKQKIIDRNICHSCLHFVEIIEEPPSERRVIVDGNVYWRKDFKENPEKYSFLGFAGHKFKIKMFDGREYITNDLWHNGEIPDRFKGRLTDNAKFI